MLNFEILFSVDITSSFLSVIFSFASVLLFGGKLFICHLALFPSLRYGRGGGLIWSAEVPGLDVYILFWGHIFGSSRVSFEGGYIEQRRELINSLYLSC